MKKSENENLRIKKSENGKSETSYNLVEKSNPKAFWDFIQTIIKLFLWKKNACITSPVRVD